VSGRAAGGRDGSSRNPDGAGRRTGERLHSSASAPREAGSIAVFVLFACLAVAVLVQILSVIVMCADRTLTAEEAGRVWMYESDQALASLRQTSLAEWQTKTWSFLPGVPDGVEASLAGLADGEGWVMTASARHEPAVTPIVVSAWLERARDGLDLPLAGLVASAATCTSGRASPWLEIDDGAGSTGGALQDQAEATARFWTAPAAPLVGPGITLGRIATPWMLDGGWRRLFEAAAEAQREASTSGEGNAPPGVAVASEVVVLSGRAGSTVELPAAWGLAAGGPGLVVVAGGVSLDARDRNDVYGVIVVDGGDILLEGTRLHGALFASGAVDFGTNGSLSVSYRILRWATDRSLLRTRLVPGTRREDQG
jgi:hypothetical protein